MVNKTKEATIAARTTALPLQSSPLHETPGTPPEIKRTKRILSRNLLILDNCKFTSKSEQKYQ